MQYDEGSDNSMYQVLRKRSDYGGEGWPGRTSQMTWELELEGRIGFHQAACGRKDSW